MNKINHKLLNVLEDGGMMSTREVVRILILLVVMGWSLLSCTSYCVLRLAVTKLSCSHRCVILVIVRLLFLPWRYNSFAPVL